MSLLVAPVGALLFPSPVPLAPAFGAPAAAPLARALSLEAFAAVGRARHAGHRRGAAQRAVQQRDAVQVAADRRNRRCRCSARLGGRRLGRRGRSRGPGRALATRLGTSVRWRRRGWSGGRRPCSRRAGGRRRGGTGAAACWPDAWSTAAHGRGGRGSACGRSRGPGRVLATRLGTSVRWQRRGWSGGRLLWSTAAHGGGGGRSACGRRRTLRARVRWQGRGRRVSCRPWRRASARPLAPIATWFRARARRQRPRTWQPQRHGPGPADVRRPLRRPSGCFSARMHRLGRGMRALAPGRRSGSGRRVLRRQGLGRAPPRPLGGRRAARAGARAAAAAAAPAAPAAAAVAGGAPPGALASAFAALGAGGDSARQQSRQGRLLGRARAGRARRRAAAPRPAPGSGLVGRAGGRQRRGQQLRAARVEQAGEGRCRGEQAALGRAVLQQRAPGRAGDQRAAVPDHPQRAPARRPAHRLSPGSFHPGTAARTAQETGSRCVADRTGLAHAVVRCCSELQHLHIFCTPMPAASSDTTA